MADLFWLPALERRNYSFAGTTVTGVPPVAKRLLIDIAQYAYVNLMLLAQLQTPEVAGEAHYFCP